jgi:hypothetical protein
VPTDILHRRTQIDMTGPTYLKARHCSPERPVRGNTCRQHTGRGAFLLADLALFAIGRRLKIIARLAVVAGFAFSFVCPVELVDSLR